MYAFELFFDRATDLRVGRYWQHLADLKISSFMIDIDQARPHLTLAVCNDVSVKSAKLLMDSLASQSGFTLNFDILASFPVSGTLFLAPTVTEKLLQFHHHFHDQIHGISSGQSQYYLPDHWHPHCTLATQLSRASLVQAYGYIAAQFEPMKSFLTEIGLVELIYADEICLKNIHRCSTKWLA